MLNVSRCSQRIMHKVRVQHQKLNMPICSLEFSAYCFILAAKSYSLHPQAVYCSFTLGKKQLLLTFPVKGAWRATWPTQHSCLREGQLCSSPRPPGMWWEHQHQAHTETTKFSCLELNSILNVHKMLYILPPFLPGLSRAECFYSVCTTQLIQDGFVY